jgi:hypothetical protein
MPLFLGGTGIVPADVGGTDEATRQRRRRQVRHPVPGRGGGLLTWAPAEAVPGGLQNLGDGYYQLDWRTPRSYARSCKLVTVAIADGARHQVEVRFTR